ncbi:ATP-binding protein [Streptomyces sp. NBC_01455]|uniref:ATP-binding protein n=1 Tax=Streptomyces sp. NBC_01455 TaxID=2903874 RepID=UPI002E338F34|nr:ATP-binding protein [Streptomyces sp. NBC_01455]
MSRYDNFGLRLRCVMPFEAAPAELPLLRQRLRSLLDHWGVSAVAEEAELAVTELAANVIKHVGEGAAATLVLEPGQDRLRVELHDKSHAVPTLSSGSCDAECGRGLHLLSAMSLEWGTLLTVTGKAVWCEIPLEPARHFMRVQRAAALLDAYRRVVGTSSVTVPTAAVLEDSATDAITDLLHWLAAQGRDPDRALDQAQIRYEAEAGAA